MGPGFFTPAMAANAFMYDRPEEITKTEFERRMEPFVKDLVSVEQGWDKLKKFVRERIERLEERMELMGYREARQLNAALGVAQSPCDRDGETTNRYMNQSDRIWFAAVRSLQVRCSRSGERPVETSPGRKDPPSPKPEPRSLNPRTRGSRNGVGHRGNGPPGGCDSGRHRSKRERTRDDASRCSASH